MRCCKAALALLMLLLTAACGHVHPAGVALEPNPPPPPGYVATCSSLPLPFNGFITGCAPAIAEEQVVVEARG